MADHDIPSAGAVDRLAELVRAADDDRRAKRRLLDRAGRALAADAESERRAKAALTEAEHRAKAVEADAEARIRAAEARLRVSEREHDADRAERQARRAEAAAVREARAEAAAVRRQRWAARRDMLSSGAPAVLSMVVYVSAVASAVFGQVSVATGRYNWAPWRALLLAGFIELMALAMALTANRLRLRGERAFAPRVLTWVFAGFAASINVWGHLADPLMATGLGAASLGGITLWEIRSSARHRDALRTAGQLAHPMPPLGARFWALHPAIAVTAYRLGVRQQLSANAAPLVAAAEAKRKGLPYELPVVPLTIESLAAKPRPAGQAIPSGQPPIKVPESQAIKRPESSAIKASDAPAIERSETSPIKAPEAPVFKAPEVIAVGSADDSDEDGIPAEETETVQPVAEAEPTGHQPDQSDRRSGDEAQSTMRGLPALLGATGEFRALTAPEHYFRDAVDGQRMPLLSRQHAVVAAPMAAEIIEGSTTGGSGGGSGDSGAKRGGVPVEAREWIAEQLAAQRVPTGPEVGRRYQVDASTGRRWIRQIRNDAS